MELPYVVRPGGCPRPREFLRLVEDQANRIRKLLQAMRPVKSTSGSSGSTDDAVALAELVERLAHWGQGIAAVDAIDLAERVELLIDMLGAEVDGLLTS